MRGVESGDIFHPPVQVDGAAAHAEQREDNDRYRHGCGLVHSEQHGQHEVASAKVVCDGPGEQRAENVKAATAWIFCVFPPRITLKRKATRWPDSLSLTALLELLEALKAADVDDRIRSATETLYQALIEAELTAVIGAGPHERTDARTAQRNGHR